MKIKKEQINFIMYKLDSIAGEVHEVKEKFERVHDNRPTELRRIQKMNKIPIKSSEAEQQKQLIRWCNTMCDYPKYSELALMYHCPNGGSRNRKEAYHLKLEGVKAGVPDLFLPVARGGYFGLYIEMKWESNKTTVLQDWWLKKLSEQGYLCCICYGFEDARKTIEKYIDLPRTKVKEENPALDIYSPPIPPGETGGLL